MQSIELKKGRLLYYGNLVGYQKDNCVVADPMFRRKELEAWLSRKGLNVRWVDGVYDSLANGFLTAADSGKPLKSIRIWQLGPLAPITMRFIGLDKMVAEYGGPDLSWYQVVFDGDVGTNDLEELWELFCRRKMGPDGQPLAISDMIELYDATGSGFYYVDRISIVPVQPNIPGQTSHYTMSL